MLSDAVPQNVGFLVFVGSTLGLNLSFLYGKWNPLAFLAVFVRNLVNGLKKIRKIHENINSASFQLKASKYKFWEP